MAFRRCPRQLITVAHLLSHRPWLQLRQRFVICKLLSHALQAHCIPSVQPRHAIKMFESVDRIRSRKIQDHSVLRASPRPYSCAMLSKSLFSLTRHIRSLSAGQGTQGDVRKGRLFELELIVEDSMICHAAGGQAASGSKWPREDVSIYSGSKFVKVPNLGRQT